ncbi:MAG: hypothetical protein HW416_2405 [Chloroflexi bacterium]|nr:hypothetical protein [Chloroflexota bacterium]
MTNWASIVGWGQPGWAYSAVALAIIAGGCASPSNRDLAVAPPMPDPALSEPGSISLDRNFYIVIDGSGSMSEKECAGAFATRVEAAKWAVNEFTARSVPSDVNLGLYIFDSSGSRERVPIGRDNRAAIKAQVDRTTAGGGTPLNAAIQSAVVELARQRNRQMGYGEYYVVLATDGAASDGDLASGGVRYAQQNGIPIITIGFCLNQDHALSKGSFSYRNANSPADLLGALQETQGEAPYFDASAFRSTR